MDEAERRKLIEDQTRPIYEQIGRIVVAYSQVVHAVQSSIACRVPPILQGKLSAYTAALPDRELFRLFTREIEGQVEPDSDDAVVVRNIAKRLTDAEETRNRLLHSVWFVGWGSKQDTDFTSAQREKFARTGKLGSVSSDAEKWESLEPVARRFEGLRQDAWRLSMIAFPWDSEKPAAGTVARNFVKDGNGNFRDPYHDGNR